MTAVPLEARLNEYGIPAATITELLQHPTVREARSVILYGSYARGDQHPGSDVDLLLVADRPNGSRKLGIANVATYMPSQLDSARGSLFGMHLARDGRVLHDTDGMAADLLARMGTPDPIVLFERIRHLGAVLDGRSNHYLGGRIRVARYLLRTAIYVEALAVGEPCFSVRELAERAGEPELVDILTADGENTPPPSLEVFADLVQRLHAIVGVVASNPHGDLRNLVVTEWFEDPSRASLGVLVLAGEEKELDYTALAKVVL